MVVFFFFGGGLITSAITLITFLYYIPSAFINNKKQNNELDENGNEIFSNEEDLNERKKLSMYLKLFIISILAAIIGIFMFIYAFKVIFFSDIPG